MMQYASLILYDGGRYVMTDDNCTGFLVLHSLSKAIMTEPLKLVPSTRRIEGGIRIA